MFDPIFCFHIVCYYCIQIMSTENVEANFHTLCLTQETFSESNLTDTYRLLATNVDRNGLRYVSIVESIDKPFYGVQFHPEKNMFEFSQDQMYNQIPHTSEAMISSQYFANFFVNEARKSKHFFDRKSEQDLLIYNYNPDYTISEEEFEQMYFFKSSVKYHTLSLFLILYCIIINLQFLYYCK